MNSVSHSYTGAVVGIGYATLCFPEQSVFLVLAGIAGAIGGLLPDIDKRGSKIANKAKLTSFIVEKTFGHRGLFHTPFFSLLVFLILFVVLNTYLSSLIFSFLLPCFFGYLSHLLLDFMTPQGIMLFYPFSKKYSHIFGLKSRFRDGIVIVIVTFILMIIWRI